MVKFVQEWNLTLTIRHGKVLIEGPFNTYVYIADRWTLNKINLLKKTRNHLMPFPVGMRCLWESSIRSTLRETFRDLLETSQKRWLFCDVFKTSQIHLKKDVFCVTSLRRLKNISKKILSLRGLKNISRSQVFVIFQKYPTKMISCDFRRVIIISDKIDVGPLETLKKWNVYR